MPVHREVLLAGDENDAGDEAPLLGPACELSRCIELGLCRIECLEHRADGIGRRPSGRAIAIALGRAQGPSMRRERGLEVRIGPWSRTVQDLGDRRLWSGVPGERDALE